MTVKSADPSVAFLIESEMKDWEIPPTDVPMLLAQTARSLDTVTKLTQYEDEKANRLLTAVAFISAFVATLFGTIPNRFPPGSITKLWHDGIHVRAVVLGCVYGLFCLYGLLIGIGVAMIIHGVRPRFIVPRGWVSGKKPKSLLFFQRIAETDPAQWAQSYCQTSARDVESTYIKNSIVETYLISQKIGLKVKWLKRGVGFFFAGALVVITLVGVIVFSLVTTAAP